ncbi:MAG: DUF559 domain-containing protein [Nocardioidaceae bacterium]
MSPTTVPTELRGRPFLLQEALQAGVSRRALQSRRYRRLHRGVYVCADAPFTVPLLAAGALLVLPPDALVSHLTALQLLGADVGPRWPLHFSTMHRRQVRVDGVTCHRSLQPLARRELDGLPICTAQQAWVQSSLKLDLVERVVAAERLLHLGRTTLPALWDNAQRLQHGVGPARRALLLVRERAESPRETTLRLMLVLSGLPEPRLNVPLGDEHDFVARPDLVYLDQHVAVEYDGEHHWRDRRQREHDIHRREALESGGWRVIVVTAQSIRRPRDVVERVHRALTASGYRGPVPSFGPRWRSLFEGAGQPAA